MCPSSTMHSSGLQDVLLFILFIRKVGNVLFLIILLLQSFLTKTLQNAHLQNYVINILNSTTLTNLIY